MSNNRKKISDKCEQLKNLVNLQRDLLMTDDNVNSELMCIQTLQFCLINDVIDLVNKAP